MKRLDAFVIEGNPDSRSRLHQAVHASGVFARVSPIANFEEALIKFRANEPCDTVLISSSFDRIETHAFIESLREASRKLDCAIILMLKPEDQNGIAVANHMLLGADGFLVEPYSVDSIRQAAELTQQIKSENQKARFKSATKLLISTMMDELERRAYAITKGQNPPQISKHIRQAAEVFRSLHGAQVEDYFETMLEMFSQSQPKAKTGLKAKGMESIKQAAANANQ